MITKITHEDVKRFLTNFDYWLNEQTSDYVCKYLTNYITQQEKVSKLLMEIKQELAGVAGDYLISSGEYSKQEFAKHLLEKLKEELND